jgi:hypothetical protein
MNINSLWVIELNVYQTIKWNSLLRVMVYPCFISFYTMWQCLKNNAMKLSIETSLIPNHLLIIPNHLLITIDCIHPWSSTVQRYRKPIISWLLLNCSRQANHQRTNWTSMDDTGTANWRPRGGPWSRVLWRIRSLQASDPSSHDTVCPERTKINYHPADYVCVAILPSSI